MAGAESGWGADIEAMGRQAWDAWSQALREAASAPLEAAAPAWQQVPGGWPGWTPPQANGAADVVGRLDGLARHWFGRMQNVAGQFADRDNTPEEIVAAWRQAMGATPTNPYPDLFGGLFGQGATDLDGLSAQWMPWLESLRGPLQDWANTPAFGPAREHQQRWKALLQAQQALREANARYQHMLEAASRQAYALFEQKLEVRAGQGPALDSARALFDEWIDAAEDAYATMALSEEFREAFGALANAQMRMRASLQREIEQLGGLLGLPTRTEVDAAHRKIAELERAMRRLMRGGFTEPAAPAGRAAAAPRCHQAGTKPRPNSARRQASDSKAKPANKTAKAATPARAAQAAKAVEAKRSGGMARPGKAVDKQAKSPEASAVKSAAAAGRSPAGNQAGRHVVSKRAAGSKGAA